MRARALVVAVVCCLVLPLPSRAQTATAPAAKPLMWTGITGYIRSKGLDDPQYVLSFVPVQRLMLDAVDGPVTKPQIDAALSGLPIAANDLVRLGLLRPDGQQFRLSYLLVTARDAERIDAVGAAFGASLADAFRAHQGEFEAIVSPYQPESLRRALLFDLIAGASLNWEGLRLTTRLGYRAANVRRADGNFFVHSQELGAHVDATGLYEDSQTAQGASTSFTTFGDGRSAPRLKGWPDVFDGMSAAVAPWKAQPQLYQTLLSLYSTYSDEAFDDGGAILDAIAGGRTSAGAVEAAVAAPKARVDAVLALLERCGYVNDDAGRLTIGVPYLRASDGRIASDAVRLSATIMTQWLRSNYGAVHAQLHDLSPARNGIPFDLVFSEVWHAIFGHASKSLAESGFYANPRAETAAYPGYEPLVWKNDVLQLP